MKQHIESVRLILGQPCIAIEAPLGHETPYLEPHRHEYWEIIWCLDDKGTQEIDFIEYENQVGRIFTISPGQVHQSDPTSSNVRLLVFAHGFIETNKRSTRLVESIFSTRGSRAPFLDCDEEAEQFLLPVFSMIQQECSREDDCDWALVESLINCFLRYILRYASNSDLNGKSRDVRVGELLDLINANYKLEKSCQFYADKLALTGKRINELVKMDLGKTVTQLIHERIILEANRELAFSNKTIKAISLDLGFNDPAYFSRFYRNSMKESPAAFRVRCSDSATL